RDLHAALLAAGGEGEPASFGARDSAGKESQRRQPLQRRPAQHRLRARPLWARIAEQPPQRQPDEELEAERRRRGVAGQAEEEPAARRSAEEHRLAGPDRDLMKDEGAADALERLLGMVVIAHAGAAGGDEDLGVG